MINKPIITSITYVKDDVVVDVFDPTISWPVHVYRIEGKSHPHVIFGAYNLMVQDAHNGNGMGGDVSADDGSYDFEFRVFWWNTERVGTRETLHRVQVGWLNPDQRTRTWSKWHAVPKAPHPLPPPPAP